MSLEEIDAIIDRLSVAVEWSKQERSRAGYFAALYRKVTVAVRDSIVAGRFENPDLMTQLDVVFARRYLDAFDGWRVDGELTGAWEAAFAATGKWRLLVVQHLLVGMNAHINLDLGIAAATVAPPGRIADVKSDFFAINDLLASLVRGVIDDIGQVSPWIGALDRIGGRTQDTLVKFSIDKARDEAWRLAEILAALPTQEDWVGDVDARDLWSAGFAGHLVRPGPFLPFGLFFIRLRESNNIASVIDVLGD